MEVLIFMENLIDELLKKVTKMKKQPEIYEIFLKLDKVDVHTKEGLRKFIDNLGMEGK